jgi:hypothetical protein
MKSFFEKYGAILLAVILAFALAFIYCKPELEGKVLQSGDNVNAMSNLQELSRYTEETGDYSWWTGAVFSGMPSYQIGGGQYLSEELTAPIRRRLHRGITMPAWILVYYFLCYALLMRSFGVNKWLSIVGGIATGLSSYFLIIIAAGHFTKPVSLTYIPLVAAGFYLLFRKRYLLGSVMVMFFTAMGFHMHPQMSYYIFMMIGVCYVAEFVQHAREKRWKDLGIATLLFVLSLGIGLGTGCANIFANREYTQETMRGGHSDLVPEGESTEAAPEKGLDIQYATQWSYGIDESFSFLIPGFKGGSSNYELDKSSHTYKTAVALGLPPRAARDFVQAIPLYWGPQPFTSGNVYMGAIICFLFLLGCLIVKGPYKWALLISTVFSIMLAWGSNFMWLTELFFNHVPLYNKFRAVSSILVVAEIAMPLLGFLALKALMDGSVQKEKARKDILIAGGVTAGLCLFFALFGKSMYNFTGPYDTSYLAQLPSSVIDAIKADRAALLTSDAWRSFAFIVAACVLVYLFNEKKLKLAPLALGLGVLILADLWPVDKRYFNDSYFQTPTIAQHVYDKEPWEEALLQDPDPHFRIMNLTTNTFNESRSSYYLKSIGGYHAAKLRRYQDLIDEHLGPMHIPVIGMLNAKYIIVADENGQPEIQLNPDALGNAWFVESLVVADGARAESDALNEIDLRHTAVVDRSFADFVREPNPGIAPDAEVHLTAYTPKQLDYDYTTSQPGTIAFSEIYYPYGWKASIDGQPVDHFRVNYTLRALNVPAGSHHITFLFDPDSVRKGDNIATACILVMYLLMAALLILAIVPCFKRSSENHA